MNALHGMPESRTHLDQAGHLEDWFGLSCLVLSCLGWSQPDTDRSASLSESRAF